MQVFQDQVALQKICKKHGIKSLSLFGSTLKGTSTPGSDIDILVVFEPAAKPSYFDMAQIEIELSELVGGRKVDLRTAAELSRYFRDEVLASAVLQYAA